MRQNGVKIATKHCVFVLIYFGVLQGGNIHVRLRDFAGSEKYERKRKKRNPILEIVQ